MKPLTEQQIIEVLRLFCPIGINNCNTCAKAINSKLLTLQGEPTKELCPICGRELTRTCFYCTKELCSPFNLQEKGEPTKDIPDKMIKKWAEKEYPIKEVDYLNPLRLTAFRTIKAMQSGEIARWAKENGN